MINHDNSFLGKISLFFIQEDDVTEHKRKKIRKKYHYLISTRKNNFSTTCVFSWGEVVEVQQQYGSGGGCYWL